VSESHAIHRGSPLVERFASGGPIFCYAVAGLTHEHEQARPGPGGWSMAELAAHLVDSDLVYADRMKRVLSEEMPVLQAFEENSWISGLHAHATSVPEAAGLFAANRQWMSRILRRCSEADFARAGMHTENGKMTLAEILSSITNHLDHHLRFVYGKRANLGLAIPPRYTSEAL
jgi:uncharacterized damage-inducible protein DinB